MGFETVHGRERAALNCRHRNFPKGGQELEVEASAATSRCFHCWWCGAADPESLTSGRKRRNLGRSNSGWCGPPTRGVRLASQPPKFITNAEIFTSTDDTGHRPRPITQRTTTEPTNPPSDPQPRINDQPRLQRGVGVSTAVTVPVKPAGEPLLTKYGYLHHHTPRFAYYHSASCSEASHALLHRDSPPDLPRA